MKIKEEIDLSILLQYGFKKTIEETELPTYNFDWNKYGEKESEQMSLDYDVLYEREEEIRETHYVLFKNRDDFTFDFCKYVCNIGDSRRGQSYYLLVDDNRNLSIYASEPDGSGGSVKLNDVLLKMFKNNLFE